MNTLLILAELAALFLLSRTLSESLFALIYLLTRSRTVGITAVAALTFPGTVIHELAHLFTAEILGVHTGKLTLVPENLGGEEVKAGSVMVAKSDPFRRYAIGVAPLFAGTLAIAALAYLLTISASVWLSVLYFYLLFAVSSGMFSSAEDLKGFLPFAAVLGALVAAAWLAGLRIGITGTLLDLVTAVEASLTQSLGIVVAINLGGLIAVRSLLVLASRLTHRTLVRS